LIQNQALLLFLIPVMGVGSYIFFAYVFKVVELYKIKHIFSGLIKKLRPSSL
jgi:hypothetical protein